jgi:hypothetical protein
MNKIFYIDGGAGRVIAAIPALKKYAKLHPNEEWSVFIAGWDNLLWGIPELQDRTYNPDTKGIFDNIIMKADVIVTPEPYRVPGYFKQELSLAEAFDKEINETDDHSDLEPPTMVFSKAEQQNAANFHNYMKGTYKKKKTIIIQPFGRSARIDGQPTDPCGQPMQQQSIMKPMGGMNQLVPPKIIIDDSTRSLTKKAYLKLTKELSKKYNVAFFGEKAFALDEDVAFKPEFDLRMWGAVIKYADYFIGCDSVGQHMARATETPGTVFIGSTYPINTSYQDYFKIIDKEGIKKYSPIRLCGLDGHLADRMNEDSMRFTDEEFDEIIKNIIDDIEGVKE